jgi:lysophospholipase L1-like esterase
VIVLLAVANIVFWVGVNKGKSSKASFAQQKPMRTPAVAVTPPTPVTADPLRLPAPSGRPLMVSIVGDSVAAGHYASGPDERFQSIMLSVLAARGRVTPVEATATGTSPLSTAVTVPSGVDLVVLEVGTDDMRAQGVTDFERTFKALVAMVHTSSPNADLVCAGTWSATGGLYDAAIQRACTGARARYVSLQALYDTPAYHGPVGDKGFYGVSDGIAPNDTGHRAIAAALLGAVGLTLS